MFYLYILYNPGSDRYYVGHAADPWKRLAQHNSEDTRKFTGKFHHWELRAVFEISPVRAEAMKIEKFIKKQKSRAIAEQQLN